MIDHFLESAHHCSLHCGLQPISRESDIEDAHSHHCLMFAPSTFPKQTKCIPQHITQFVLQQDINTSPRRYMTPGTVKVYKLTQAGYNPECPLSYEYSNIITI
jgi:hypothetical protein